MMEWSPVTESKAYISALSLKNDPNTGLPLPMHSTAAFSGELFYSAEHSEHHNDKIYFHPLL